MKRISNKRLIELGFKQDHKYGFIKGWVMVGKWPKEDMDISVSSPITSSSDYAQTARGVKNEKDLLELCRLINGNKD